MAVSITWGPFVGVLAIGALLFGVYTMAPDFLKLSYTFLGSQRDMVYGRNVWFTWS